MAARARPSKTSIKPRALEFTTTKSAKGQERNTRENEDDNGNSDDMFSEPDVVKTPPKHKNKRKTVLSDDETTMEEQEDVDEQMAPAPIGPEPEPHRELEPEADVTTPQKPVPQPDAPPPVVRKKFEHRRSSFISPEDAERLKQRWTSDLTQEESDHTIKRAMAHMKIQQEKPNYLPDCDINVDKSQSKGKSGKDTRFRAYNTKIRCPVDANRFLTPPGPFGSKDVIRFCGNFKYGEKHPGTMENSSVVVSHTISTTSDRGLPSEMHDELLRMENRLALAHVSAIEHNISAKAPSEHASSKSREKPFDPADSPKSKRKAVGEVVPSKASEGELNDAVDELCSAGEGQLFAFVSRGWNRNPDLRKTNRFLKFKKKTTYELKMQELQKELFKSIEDQAKAYETRVKESLKFMDDNAQFCGLEDGAGNPIEDTRGLYAVRREMARRVAKDELKFTQKVVQWNRVRVYYAPLNVELNAELCDLITEGIANSDSTGWTYIHSEEIDAPNMADAKNMRLPIRCIVIYGRAFVKPLRDNGEDNALDGYVDPDD